MRDERLGSVLHCEGIKTMQLIQIIYASMPFGYDEAHLDDILTISRRNNTRDGITGALICRADLYLQWLEGPEEMIDALVMRLRDDDRHQDIHIIARNETAERMFPAWAMRDDPAQSWMWSQDDVAKGAVARATPQEVSAVFERLAAKAL
jgi:Sensors of blue-light using FAD